MTHVTLSEAGLALIAAEGEYQNNIRTLRRLERDRRELDERINNLRKRQARIEAARSLADSMIRCDPQLYTWRTA